MISSIRSWGNSQGLYIPKKLLNEVNLQVNDAVEISVSGNTILIRKDESSDVKRRAWESLQAIRSAHKERQILSSDDYRKERNEYLDEKYGR